MLKHGEHGLPYAVAKASAHTIPVVDFSTQVAATASKLSRTKIVPYQITEAVAGITNLYRSASNGTQKPAMEFVTERGFVSDAVPLDKLLTNIQYCSGVNKRVADVLLHAIEKTLQGYFEKGPRRRTLNPIGSLEVQNLNASSYKLTLEESASIYDRTHLARK